jgi:hypothetical protein
VWKTSRSLKQWPSQCFFWNFAFDMREYIPKRSQHQNCIWKKFIFCKNIISPHNWGLNSYWVLQC